jgi:DNA-directed RNA polymerase subunit RPC12/RpoP
MKRADQVAGATGREPGVPRHGMRVVQCYHCRHRSEVSPKAESIACPACNQRVIVGDVIVRELRPVSRVQTCGRIVVHEKARINAELVEAHEGVEVLGGLSASVVSGGPVIIGPKARWAGDCRAPSLRIHLGARIESGRFTVPDHGLGLEDLPGHTPAGGLPSKGRARR